MNLLAIDASTEACSVAILKDDQVLSDFELCPQSHSVVLLPMVDKLLAKAGARLTDFDALVYGRGPGSFTGVRIGIGVAQGLAFAADLPTIGISTMQAMAQQAYEQEGKDTVSVAIDARMAEVYCSNWQVNEQGLMALVGEERVLPPEQFAQSLDQSLEQSPKKGQQHYGAGTGWQAYQEAFQPICANLEKISVMYPNAQFMLALAKQEFLAGKALPAEQAQPVYVRDTVSWKKLPGRE
ncbi:tRNA (adenosine(37)-N6)-threonylcarbamoyltransferase complex dimerization subunit type 1 TsaB [Thalassotalea euphylliae]|uniref:tRNA (adenosine(37)-N6)-threonylcarbamoyltransferase complex dimerization subunit type 1 TsaB n=1 Tax=Thalassotalea euphylliae TaxID=1655234 RepID=UPI001C6EDADA|nr:tRNA (adenosine(37)-N6)-threonylcarbamoyltransferase complex dimerization subunit type 1 TsaB [Thalassotalea euphylliae]